MSVSINHPCTMCKNSIKITGSYGMPRCKAFPNGKPPEFLLSEVDVRKLKECNNGYKYEYNGSQKW